MCLVQVVRPVLLCLNVRVLEVLYEQINGMELAYSTIILCAVIPQGMGGSQHSCRR